LWALATDLKNIVFFISARAEFAMSESRDMIIPMLQDMREEMRSQFESVKERLDRLEGGQKSIRNAMTHETMLSKFLLGDFEERLAVLERRVDELGPSRAK
jgi:hypothetical protein